MRIRGIVEFGESWGSWIIIGIMRIMGDHGRPWRLTRAGDQEDHGVRGGGS